MKASYKGSRKKRTHRKSAASKEKGTHEAYKIRAPEKIEEAVRDEKSGKVSSQVLGGEKIRVTAPLSIHTLRGTE